MAKNTIPNEKIQKDYHEKNWFGEPVLLSFPATLITLVVLSQGKTMHYERMTHEEEYVYVFEVQLFVSCVVICFT